MARGKQTAATRTSNLVTDAREVIKTCPAINTRLAARRISAFLESRMQDTGLSIAQFGLMAHIAATRDDTIGGLAERLGLDQSTLSRNLRTLERNGWVEIVIAEQDLRRRAVWLTETGARKLQAAIPAWRSANAALSAVVGQAQLLRLARSTSTLIAAASRASLPNDSD